MELTSTSNTQALELEPMVVSVPMKLRGRSALILATEALKRGGMAAGRAITHLLRREPLTDPRHRWGDPQLGGGLGLLELAIEVASPALVRRCLAQGCPIEHRTRVIAWRTGNPDIVWQLESVQGRWERVWPDEELEQRVAHTWAKQNSKQLRRRLDSHTEEATGTGKQAGRL